jgi:type III secretion system-like peptide-binding chaperone
MSGLPKPEEDPVTDEPNKPAEGSLLDDPATADLGAKVAQAWTEFGHALSDALPTLPVGSRLEITLDPTAAGMAETMYEVLVTAEAEQTLTAYAVSNMMLPPEYRLSRTVVGELVELGWTPPGVDGDNRFSLRLPAASAGRVAAIVARTFRDAYGSPHPAFLRYRIEPAGPEPLEVPALGAARPLAADGEAALPGPADLSALSLPDKVTTVIAAMLRTTPEKLPVDKDGDIGIRSGSAMVFVRVRDNPPLVDVFSPVLTEVDATEQLYVKLSELTHRMPIGRLYCTGETVWASVPVLGRDFQPSHLMLAVQVMTGLADELDDRLHGEFGGKRFWVDSDRPGIEADDQHTGFYL